ncbi:MULTISPECIES: GNAT family N-acetyltransferase [Rhodococcus]|uniref:GNAT family N-acetyltransferase n=1 Tax=Rhodococcus TaxID=1827 RepID=UPI00138FAA06|nr:GNAT family N-acetyltransferase [Rhodococcus pyridinivorans]
MPAFVVVPTIVEFEGLVDLLSLAVGGTDPERLDRACACYRAGPAELAAVFAEDSPIGVVGYLCHAGTPRTVELLHIATDRRWQHRGIGTALVRWVQAQYPGALIEAQTDHDAVGFYRSIGFGIESLGELYPGVERFRAVSKSRSASEDHQVH